MKTIAILKKRKKVKENKSLCIFKFVWAHIGSTYT
jgi:hypothetical protein